MGDVTFPPRLIKWIETRVAEGGYANAQDYLNELVRRDKEAASAETEWLREQIRIGKESGVIAKDARQVLRDIIAERPSKRA